MSDTFTQVSDLFYVALRRIQSHYDLYKTRLLCFELCLLDHVSYVVHSQEDMKNFRQKLVAILFTSKYAVPNGLPVLEISRTICGPSDEVVEVIREQFISRESPLDSVHSTLVDDSTMQPQAFYESVNK